MQLHSLSTVGKEIMKDKDIDERIEDLLMEVEALRKTKKKDKYVRRLDEYTNVEKIVAFEKLYASALAHLERIEVNGFAPSRDEHYMFEEVMELLSAKDGPKIWDYYNSLDG